MIEGTYEEGCNLPDAHYEKWSRLNHSEINVHSDSRLPILTLHCYLKREEFSQSKFILHQFKFHQFKLPECQTLIRVLKHHLHVPVQRLPLA